MVWVSQLFNHNFNAENVMSYLGEQDFSKHLKATGNHISVAKKVPLPNKDGHYSGTITTATAFGGAEEINFNTKSKIFNDNSVNNISNISSNVTKPALVSASMNKFNSTSVLNTLPDGVKQRLNDHREWLRRFKQDVINSKQLTKFY